jgi:hypothetical protein
MRVTASAKLIGISGVTLYPRPNHVLSIWISFYNAVSVYCVHGRHNTGAFPWKMLLNNLPANESSSTVYKTLLHKLQEIRQRIWSEEIPDLRSLVTLKIACLTGLTTWHYPNDPNIAFKPFQLRTSSILPLARVQHIQISNALINYICNGRYSSLAD